jgi:uncharacterized protein (DUF433 family)
MVAFKIVAESPPLITDRDGVIRVGQTRVTLDTIVEAFNEGLAAEDIASQYPTLRLADIYGAIAYYLNHKQEVDDYLTQRAYEAVRVRAENEARFNLNELRARILARHAEQK